VNISSLTLRNLTLVCWVSQNEKRTFWYMNSKASMSCSVYHHFTITSLVLTSRSTQWSLENEILTPCLPVCFQPETISLHVFLYGNLRRRKCWKAFQTFKRQKTRQAFESTTKPKFSFWVFCDWRHKWSCFRLLWPTSSGLGPNR